MKKIFVSIALIILLSLIGGIAYLLIRPCDYQAHFTVKTTPDIAYFNILNWNIWNRKQASSKIEITSKNPVKNISKKVLLNDTTLIFNWEFKQLNDSITMVRACVSDPDRKLYNRLTVPFMNTPFKNSVRGNLLDIKTKLELMLKTFHYEFTGYDQFEKKSCVCISLKSTPRGKARAMISNVTELNQFVRQNSFELDGNPFVVVHDWNEFNDSISFDFCFPITQTDAVPEHPEIKFITVEGMDAIKTDFYGNYSITDITWRNLAEQANKLGYRSNHKLIEVYLNDPHSGGNELEWKAEIYLGIESVD
ncbi:MAG: GyrI-like domain-containing protein [Bacteroidales bacterium]|nr:GyrI-like domain-containing protein [Bacteroidales bacterium]